MKPKYIYLAIISLTFCLCSCVESQKVVIAKSGINYVKPTTSKDVIQGEKVKYQLWYDKDKWGVSNKEHPEYKKFEEMMATKTISTVLIHKSPEIIFFVHETRLPIPYEKMPAPLEMHIISKEIRKVNGQDVLYIKSDENVNGGKAILFTYLLTNKYGSVIFMAATFMAATSDALLSEYESEIFDLLNGLVDPSLEKPPPTVVENVEDQNPKQSKNTLNAIIKSEAQKCVKAMIDQDFDMIVSCTYPLVIEMLGGKAKMIGIIKKGELRMKEQGTSFSSMVFEINDPFNIKKIKGVTYAIVPQKLKFQLPAYYQNKQLPKGTLVVEGHLIAISGQNNTWSFADTAKLNEENIKQILPDLVGNFILPEKKEPVFIPNTK